MAKDAAAELLPAPSPTAYQYRVPGCSPVMATRCMYCVLLTSVKSVSVPRKARVRLAGDAPTTAMAAPTGCRVDQVTVIVVVES